MDLSIEAYRSEYKEKTGNSANPNFNEFAEPYLIWKQTKLLELMNKNIEILVAAKPAKKRLL